MTDDELRAIVESNARANEANSDAIAELGAAGLRTEESLNSFIQHVDSWLEALRNSTDDQSGDLANLAGGTAQLGALFSNLRSEAISDRSEFRTQAEADRQAFRDAITASTAQADADRAESARKFDAQLNEIRAQGQQIRALLSALATTNGRVDNLEQAG